MSQPIDTDTFVSAELDLGIDLVSLEPIEEEDADYLDSVETIDKFDSKDSMGNTNISNVPANPGERQDAIYNSSRSLVREASENKIRFDDTEDERRQEDIKSDSSRGQDSSDSQIDESDAITVEVNNSSGSAIGLDRAIIGTKEASESEPTNDSVTNVVDTPIHGEGSLSAGVEGSPAAGEDAEEDADDLDKAPEVDAGEESYAAEVQVEDDTIASADELEEDDDEGPDLESVEAVVEEDANAAELDNIDEDEMQEVDAGEESYAAEVQVEDDTIASPDEVPEAEDEGAEAEAAEGAAIEEESNAAELDDIGQVEMQEVDAGEESYAEVQVEDDIIASPDEFQEAEDEGAEAENEAAEGAAVEEESNAAELDDVGLDETQEVDVGEESYAAEAQVEDDTIASPDEVQEDEGTEAEAAEGAAVEEESNAAELDKIGQSNPAAEEDPKEDADGLDTSKEVYAAEVQVVDDTIASPDEVARGEPTEGAAVEGEAHAAELDDVGEDNPAAAEEDTEEDADGLDERQEVDAVEENDAAEVQVEDDTISSLDEVTENEDEDEGPEAEAAEGAAVEEDANVLTGAAVGLFAESSRDNTEEEDRNGAKVDDEDEGIPDAGGDVEMDVNCLKDEVPEDSVAGNSNAEDVQVEDRNIATIDDIIRDKDEETDADSVEVSLQDSLASKLDCIGEDNAAAGEEEMQDESVAGMSAKEDVQVEDDNIASTDEPEVNEDEGPDPESVEPSVEDDAIAPEVDDDVEQFFAAVEVLEDEEDDKIDVDADVENGNEISGIDMSTAEIDEQELINVESIDLRNESDDGSDSDVSPLGMKSHDEKNQVSFTLDVDISEVAHNGPESKDFIEGAMPSIPQDAILQSDDKQFDALLDDGGIDGDNSPLLDGDNAADVESESALFQGSIPEPEAEHTKIATKFSDAPKTTSLSSAKSRALRNDDQWKSSQTLSTSRISSRSMSRPRTSSTSMSRPSSSGRSSIHTQLYERSIPQQEEGKKRRHEVEDSLRRRSDERNGKYCDQVYHQREKNDSKRESLKEEFSKPKKISISDAEDLYQRLLSYKIKTDERRIQLRKDRDAREMEWLNNTSKNKISPQEACGIYYRGTVSSRSRSRGRE